MLTFRVDKEDNILFVNIIGVTPKEKMAEAISDFTNKCAELKENFTIINDLTLYKMNSEHDFEVMCKITHTMLEKFSIGKVIRIVGNNKETLKKLLQIDKELGLKNIYYASNRKAAIETIHKLTHQKSFIG